MKKISLGILFASLLTLGSCTKDEPNTSTKTGGKETIDESVNLIGEANLMMPELEDEATEARVSLSVNADNSKVKFRYDNRSEREIYLLFTRSSDNAKTVSKGRLIFKNTAQQPGETAEEAAARHYRCFVYATIPAGFDPQKGVNVTVSGIFGGGLNSAGGVIPLKDDGSVELNSPRSLYFASQKTRDYDLPFYFTDRSLSYNTKLGKYVFSADFKMYGSLLAVEMRNKLIEPMRPTWLKIETEAMSFQGSLNLLNKDKNGIPVWTANTKPENTQTESHTSATRRVNGRLFTLDHLEIPAAAGEGTANYNTEADRRKTTTHVFIWGVGLNNSVGKFTATAAEHPYIPEANQEVQARYKKEKTSKKPLTHAHAYALSITPTDPSFSFDGDLIITEYYHSGVRDGLRNVIELYNPTRHKIDLSKYYIVKTNWATTNSYQHQLTFRLDGQELLQPSGAPTSTHVHLRTGNPSSRYLYPGRTMIVNSYNTIVNGHNFNQAQIIWHVGTKSGVDNDAAYNKPISGGARAAFMVFKGRPDFINLSNLVDNLGIISNGPITMNDVRTNESTMFFGDGYVRRRPDRNLPNRTLLREFYWNSPKNKAPNLDGSKFPKIKLPSAKYTMEYHINQWNARPNVDWLFTGAGVWSTTGGRTMGNRWGDVI